MVNKPAREGLEWSSSRLLIHRAHTSVHTQWRFESLTGEEVGRYEKGVQYSVTDNAKLTRDLDSHSKTKPEIPHWGASKGNSQKRSDCLSVTDARLTHESSVVETCERRPSRGWRISPCESNLDGEQSESEEGSTSCHRYLKSGMGLRSKGWEEWLVRGKAGILLQLVLGNPVGRSSYQEEQCIPVVVKKLCGLLSCI